VVGGWLDACARQVMLAFNLARAVGRPGRTVLIFVAGIAQIEDLWEKFDELRAKAVTVCSWSLPTSITECPLHSLRAARALSRVRSFVRSFVHCVLVFLVLIFSGGRVRPSIHPSVRPVGLV
jgi:hypothetical protein